MTYMRNIYEKYLCPLIVFCLVNNSQHPSPKTISCLKLTHHFSMNIPAQRNPCTTSHITHHIRNFFQKKKKSPKNNARNSARQARIIPLPARHHALRPGHEPRPKLPALARPRHHPDRRGRGPPARARHASDRSARA